MTDRPSRPNIKKHIFVWAVVGICVRIIFAPISAHSDMFYVQALPSKLAGNGLIDVYSYMDNNYKDPLLIHRPCYYPPLAYLTIGVSHCVIKSFDPELSRWMPALEEQMRSAKLTIADYLAIVKSDILMRSLLFMKLPYLIFDMLGAWLVLCFFKQEDDKLRAFKLWMINPVFVFASYIFGQFDIMMAFFLLAGIFLIFREKPGMAMISISMAALYKTTAILLLPLLVLTLGTNFKERLRLILFALMPFLLFFLPFYISSRGYVLYSLIPSSFPADTRLEIVAGRAIFIVGYMLMAILSLRSSDSEKDHGLKSFKVIITTLLLSYFMIFATIHYFTWVMPFLIIAVVMKAIPLRLYIFQMACLIIYALNSRALCAGLFMPVNAEYFSNLPSIPELMNNFFAGSFMRWGYVMAAARLLFYASSLLIITKIAKFGGSHA